MTVLFEFLDKEPIENYITCLNYNIDKVYFLGYYDEIKRQKERVKSFLTGYCGIREVTFDPISETDIQAVIKNIKEHIEYEKSQKNNVYFDITGGESLILVAFGIVAAEIKVPIHFFDVEENRIHELNTGAASSLSKDGTVREVKMNLDDYLMMQGAAIDYDRHKSNKDATSSNIRMALEIWEITREVGELWNPFSMFMSTYMSGDDSLNVSISAKRVVDILHESNNALDTPAEINAILDKFAEKGLITDLVHADGRYSFYYLNSKVKRFISEGGSALEVRTMEQESKNADYYMAGVHIDWDGDLRKPGNADLNNEIDVLKLNGFVPTFISCKSGKLNRDNYPEALFELDSLTRRFGGKYAKKKLYVTQELTDLQSERAREMNIEVVKL